MSDLTERARRRIAGGTSYWSGWLVPKNDVSLMQKMLTRIEALERDLLGLTDTHDPVARGGHCTFCHHPIGLSVFGPDVKDPTRHYDNCLWIARRALGDDQ